MEIEKLICPPLFSLLKCLWNLIHRGVMRDRLDHLCETFLRTGNGCAHASYHYRIILQHSLLSWVVPALGTVPGILKNVCWLNEGATCLSIFLKLLLWLKLCFTFFFLGLWLFIAKGELETVSLKHQVEKLSLIAAVGDHPFLYIVHIKFTPPSHAHRTWRTLGNDYSDLHSVSYPPKAYMLNSFSFYN